MVWMRATYKWHIDSHAVQQGRLMESNRGMPEKDVFQWYWRGYEKFRSVPRGCTRPENWRKSLCWRIWCPRKTCFNDIEEGMKSFGRSKRMHEAWKLEKESLLTDLVPGFIPEISIAEQPGQDIRDQVPIAHHGASGPHPDPSQRIQVTYERIFVWKIVNKWLCVCVCQSTKLDELMSKVDLMRRSVADHTASIDSMRLSRDAKVTDVDKCQLEVEVSNTYLTFCFCFIQWW